MQKIFRQKKIQADQTLDIINNEDLKVRLPPSGPASWLRSDSGNRSI
jgi:hypothetical protein